MKIRKLFQRAAALALAAVTALSAVPATTAFAAGDIGTISFTHTYDGAGNAMRYNSSANIGGHTAGGTGEYKYRMHVDGETAFCLQPGVPLKTGNTLAKASSNTWNALSADQKKAVGLALLYGYQGNSGNLSGSDDEKWLATQTLVWEFVTGCRNATSPYSQTMKKLSGRFKLIWKNQNGCCYHCGMPLDISDEREIFFKVPKSSGGKEEVANMAYVHADCQRIYLGKHLVG